MCVGCSPPLLPLTPSPVSHPLLRLVGGNSQNEGRVEIFYDGRWGTVCDDNWYIDDANVVCRELGFVRALSAPGFSTFGTGTGQVGGGCWRVWPGCHVIRHALPQIWLDEVNCAGSEASIFQCPHGGWGVHNCAHSEDASVMCTSEPLLDRLESIMPAIILFSNALNSLLLFFYYSAILLIMLNSSSDINEYNYN